MLLPMILEQLKAVGNDTRMMIMEWLKDPQAHFPPQDHGDPAIGVCMSHIQAKACLSASSASAHLAILQRAGLVQTTRIGKWTYFRRDEQAIDQFADRLKNEL
ncbi:ArsR/SmtB family transcription factor [Pseudomonas capsici]|uniref:ArsR family transcriptional regulator n=1 Tax=Pseudomonas capsici TaxID=2810614 RepID=A0ABT3C310_9PSED|nr:MULTISPECIES: helix-turn-helix transcriptional regulator [Pseudomonas]MBN6714024.1 helix-turn-helix transcriptional regulator [Pseudomonas capsici]MBN6719420.1 helix-turn-helix transcriptional regulator [Pseudomonas capsici]MBN6722766.1 helix-turn-helix transcriptional regulator [Pseudomonas capsici]MBX8474678.1 ArsR family transcriptional regulator [Pseudomonas cichorii]MBX8611847.1 ArsR family transcriptional regulator [Pseudomonas cichorii]